ncbi:hypothetical protein BJ170DRAFT_626645 [Xylariales sp. AK1849]|nr:hypothetical protein BJ170DRAFT_626645 [Xylariales sp. AK1849]
MYTPQVFITALLVASAALSGARSIENRQLLGACNSARLQIVKALGDTKSAVADIADPAVQTAAAAGVKQAQSGVADVAKSLFTGAAPSATGRDTVAAGLNATASALAGADTSDSAVTDAQTSLQDAVTAGDAVVANC